MNEVEQLRHALALRDAALTSVAARIEPLIAEVYALRKAAAPVPAAPSKVVSAEVEHAREVRRLTAEVFAKADKLARSVAELEALAALRGI